MDAQALTLENIIEDVRGRLFGFIRQRTGNETDAEDILQEVFFQLVDGYDTIRSMESTTSWLFAVARNKIADHFRKKALRLETDLSEPTGNSDDEDPVMLQDILPDFGPGPEEEMFGELIWEKVEETLELMPEEQKTVFILHEMENMNFKEMSEILNQPVNTLISRKRYAVLFLRRQLEQLYKQIKN